MRTLSNLRKIDIRTVWANEAHDFTPWLVDNLDKLSETIGIDLEFIGQEQRTGDFSLDILAKDVQTNRFVVIENQFGATNHDHLGKVVTYASGHDASVVIFIAEKFREEHRQALDWLNQKTPEEVLFFGVEIEVVQIDTSNPAPLFKMVASPNEWGKSTRSSEGTLTNRQAAYKAFFQRLVDELREEHHFTNARSASAQSWVSFSSGISTAYYGASFAARNRVRVEIYIDSLDQAENKDLFDALYAKREVYESEIGAELSWERLDNKRASRIAIYREGKIDDPEAKLEEFHQWAIENLLKFRKAFPATLLKQLKQKQ